MKAKEEAFRLLESLKRRARQNPDRFHENYGQKQIRAFRDKLNAANVPYQELNDAMSIVEEISSFTPLEH